MLRKSFQERVATWVRSCFPPSAWCDTDERSHRFLEEALELVQSTGITRENAHVLVDYVYSRPVGDPHHETGGVLVTLAALCTAMNVNLASAGRDELRRNWSKIEAIRKKQAGRPQASPLPQ